MFRVLQPGLLPDLRQPLSVVYDPEMPGVARHAGYLSHFYVARQTAAGVAMEKEQKMKRLAAKYVAYSGIVAALSVAVMLIGSYVTAAAYVCTAVASFLVFTIREECDLRHALAGYVCVSILSVLFVPYKEIVWMFVLLVGYYPLLKPALDRIKPWVLRVAAKLVLCDVTMGVLFFSMVRLIYIGQEMPELGKYAKLGAVAFVVAGNAAFLCFDFALGRILKFYRQMISPRLGKIIGLR